MAQREHEIAGRLPGESNEEIEVEVTSPHLESGEALAGGGGHTSAPAAPQALDLPAEEDPVIDSVLSEDWGRTLVPDEAGRAVEPS